MNTAYAYLPYLETLHLGYIGVVNPLSRTFTLVADIWLTAGPNEAYSNQDKVKLTPTLPPVLRRWSRVSGIKVIAAARFLRSAPSKSGTDPNIQS